MSVAHLIEQNRAWVAERTSQDPDYFRRQVGRHRPYCLYIGCSDARVPVNLITGTEPGDLFVHRNIANQVIATDTNMLAVVQYAVEVLKVDDIVVCGHEECGGVQAALGPRTPTHVESWLANLRTVARLHATELAALPNDGERAKLLVRLNVREQVRNLSLLPVIQDAWRTGRDIKLHGWAYAIGDGLLEDLQLNLGPADVPAADPPFDGQPARVGAGATAGAGVGAGAFVTTLAGFRAASTE